MSRKNRRLHPAVKHGGYSGTAVLPGEDRDAFEKLHRDLVAEFAPAGALEEDIVATMARLVWRKQNLSTYRVAEFAKNRWSEIRAKHGVRIDLKVAAFAREARSPEQISTDRQAMEEELKELGDAVLFLDLGDAVTTERLLEDLEVVDRLDSMIDRCIKRLLMVRGVKSMSCTGIDALSVSRKQLAAA